MIPDWTLVLAALAGWLVREVWSVRSAMKKNEETFSLPYYFSRPRNQVLIVSNLISSLALLLGNHEIVAIEQKYLGFGAPILTGVLVGFGAAWFFRAATEWSRKKAKEIEE